jgi:hypothetical protein
MKGRAAGPPQGASLPFTPHPIEVAGVRLPDSEATRAAEQLCRQASSRMLYAHAVRSYVFAALLARHDRMHVDDELLYVGCVLHDIGLTPDYEQPVAPFEQVSADIAVALAGRFGWPSERRETLADAIVLHMAAEVGADESPEARALEAGVAVDCTGRRLDDIAAPAVAEVLRQLPRGPFKREFGALLKQEATRKPASSAAMCTHDGLLDRIAATPFRDTA